jgi:parvulin-like peptidyl-prolyl isomerase
MKKTAFALLMLATAVSCRQRVAEDQVVARVNQATLTKEDFREAMPQGLAGISPAGKEELLRQWVNGELFYQEAKRQGLQRDPKVARQLKDIERDFLANQLMMREVYEKNTVGEAEARAYFDQHQEEYQTELRFSQILVATKEEADQLRKKLEEGGDFSKLARESSIDSLTRSRGGDLPAYFRRGSGYIPLDFEETAFALKLGGISQPIRHRDGYLLIKVTERRPALEKVKFEDVQEALISVLSMDRKKKAYDQLVERLKAGAKVETHPERLN